MIRTVRRTKAGAFTDGGAFTHCVRSRRTIPRSYLIAFYHRKRWSVTSLKVGRKP